MANFWTDEVKPDEPIVAALPFESGSKFTGGLSTLSPTGSVAFTDIRVGGQTLQYTIQNAGYFSFGDGSDGDVTISANTTLTADKYYKNLTVLSGVSLITGGYRVFCSESATVSGTISRNGNAGADGLNNSAGTGAAALSDGYLKGSVAGGDGGVGATPTGGAGLAGANISNSIGVNGVAGGAGATSDGTGGAGGAAGTVTASNVKLIANWHLATLLDVGSTGTPIKFTGSASSGGGGGGAGSAGQGAGGGGGGAGALVAIYAKKLIISSGGVISSNGGVGGNGGNAAGAGNRGAGGGGGGGSGGCVILIYNSLTNSGSIQANGGTGGTGGTGNGGSSTGANGTNGLAGVIYQFQISL